MGQLLYGVDVRKHGSLNAGATNVFRVLGWKAGVLSTVVDLGKGLLAAGVIASIRIDELPSGFAFWQVESVVRLLAGIAAIVGHMLPIWARFRGGKGVNTAAGVLFRDHTKDHVDRDRGFCIGVVHLPVCFARQYRSSYHVSGHDCDTNVCF